MLIANELIFADDPTYHIWVHMHSHIFLYGMESLNDRFGQLLLGAIGGRSDFLPGGRRMRAQRMKWEFIGRIFRFNINLVRIQVK